MRAEVNIQLQMPEASSNTDIAVSSWDNAKADEMNAIDAVNVN
jgi:hypothetical protein